MTGTRLTVGEVGDRVRLDDGTDVEIVGFEGTSYGRTGNFGLEPGIYGNPARPLVRMPDGSVDAIGSHRVDLAASGGGKRVERSSFRVGDLPDAPFWETDVVSYEGCDRAVVVHVDYLALARGADRDQAFTCEEGDGAHRTLAGEALTLVGRGPVWRRAHGDMPAFPTVDELAAFHQSVGEAHEVVNPATGTYAWDADEAAEGLLDGTVHGFHGAIRELAATAHMVRYDDEAVGEAVRAETMARLGLGAPSP